MTKIERSTPPALEEVPDGEAASIEHIVQLTLDQLKQRYRGEPPIRRGVHPKDHGCVTAKFTVLNSLRKDLQVGVFAKPGHQYDAFIRFSNAEVDPKKPDSAIGAGTDTQNKTDKFIHGSRGMALKVMGVTGSPLLTTNLLTTHGPLSQDFLMINQPVFAFANVVDYEALSEVLVQDNDRPDRFFGRMASADDDVRDRAKKTLEIVNCIKSNAPPLPYQAPPVSPLDNRYFSAAAFLFGEGRAMKFSASPVSPVPDKLNDISDENYLGTALKKRLLEAGDKAIEFHFQIQVRTAEELAGKVAKEIEDVCVDWPEGDATDQYPFETVATISIPPQNPDDQAALCEDLTFSPWNGLAEHRPLGGINRLRRAVYEASARTRHVPGGCPWDGG
jgi:hypothetical protein